MLSAEPAAERRRVSAHIACAEGQTRKSTPLLDPLRQLVRRLLLDELERYRRRGRFPQNPGWCSQPTPVFIDEHGTRCAMAHLLEAGGEHELVNKIARERNFAYVRELADEPRLRAWLAAAGLTVAEAAAIQPAYCEVQSACICHDLPDWPVPATAVLDATLLRSDPISPGWTARIDAIYGDGLGLGVGDEISLVYLAGERATAAPGDRVLAPIEHRLDPDGAETRPVGILLHDGTYTCSTLAVRQAPALTGEQLIAALRSDDCAQTLARFDGAWADQVGPDCPTTCGVSGAGDISSVGILLALIAFLVRRR